MKTTGRGTDLNLLHAKWLEATGDEKELAAIPLHRALLQFAQRLQWKLMRHENSHLQQEMVNNLWMELDTFRGDSKFSTWAYSWFRNSCYHEWRYINRNLGQSLTSVPDEDANARASTVESEMYVQEYLESLPAVDVAILDMRLDGLSLREIAEEIGMRSKSSIQRHIAKLPEVVQ